MAVSSFTSATFAVVKKYTQLACIFIHKISHRKNTLKFACKKSVCKSSFKNLHASFLCGFFMEICHIACNLCTCKCCNARGLYCTSNLHKTETSLRQTVGASPEGVCPRELIYCIESGKVFLSYYNVFCINKRCVTALHVNVSFFQMLVLATFFPTSDVSPGYMDFMGVCCFPFGRM